jgi:hypothetical protein
LFGFEACAFQKIKGLNTWTILVHYCILHQLFVLTDYKQALSLPSFEVGVVVPTVGQQEKC